MNNKHELMKEFNNLCMGVSVKLYIVFDKEDVALGYDVVVASNKKIRDPLYFKPMLTFFEFKNFGQTDYKEYFKSEVLRMV